jgi:integrase
VGRVRRSCKTNNRRDANEYSLRLYNKLEEQVQNPDKKRELTVDEVLGIYWKKIGSKKKDPSSILPKLRYFKSFFGAHTKWNHLNDNMLNDFVSKRSTDYVMAVKNFKDGKKLVPTNRKINPATINKEINLLGTINNHLDDWNIEPAKFKSKKHKLEIKDAEKEYFLKGQDEKITEELPEHYEQAFKFALLTGARAQNFSVRKGREDVAIRRRDVLLEDGIVRLYGKSRKPGGKIIEVPIVAELMEMFTEMKVKDMKPDAYLFVYPEGHYMAGKPLGYPKKALHKAMKQSGYERKRGQGFHLTRHTTATRLVQAGVDLAIVQDILGHADIKTTRVYAHRQNEQRKEAMEKALNKNN